MNKWFRRLSRGFAILGLLTIRVPMIIADGKITADEAFGLLQEIFEAGGWKMSFELPDGIKNTVVGITS